MSSNPQIKTPTKVEHTPGPWREGKNYGAVVSDVPIEGGLQGSDDVEHYGGYLIAESIASCNRPIISAAPDMLAALKAIVDAWLSPLEKRALKVEMCEAARTAIAKAERGQ